VEPLVSVITPVHNEEGHLAECIESVLAQTYQNWEYTIVDNCSTDTSLEIARRYAAKDRRIRIVENRELLEVIPNHNMALRQMSPASKYCKLVFGDDWIFPECLERMVTVAEEHPSVGIVGAFVLEGVQVRCTGLPYLSTFVSGREICRQHLLENLYVFGSANSVLYRADLVRSRHPFYTASNIHADTEVCFALLTQSDFGFVHQVLTFTRVRPGSLATFSEYVRTDLAGTLRILLAFGSAYLTPKELAERVRLHLSEYYASLARVLILDRDKEVWEYHKAKLTEAGIGFSRVRLARAALALLCGAVLTPKTTVQKLVERLRAGNVNPRKRDENLAVPPMNEDGTIGQDGIIQTRGGE
jgi:glycosyltransferase involved in cell wall biosynthesis